ncbi:MAG: YncE family protein [Solirubrobacterales bacterium]
MVTETHAGWGFRFTTVLAAGAFLAVAGCGGGETFGPAAEPAESPPVKVSPAGKVVSIGAGAEGMAFDEGSGTVALGLREPYRLAFVDPAKLFITYQVPIPNPVRHLAVKPGGNLVAVPAESANTVFEISPDRGVVNRVATGEHPHDAAFADGKLFSANEFGDTISVIEDGEDVATLPAPVQPGGIASVEDRYLAVIAVSERVLTVYDARTNEELGETPAGTGPTHIESIGGDVFVADTEGDQLLRFSVGSDPEQVDSVAAAGTPYGIAVDSRRERVWVTLTATNQLAGYRIDGPTMQRFATYPTIRQPNSVTVNPESGNVFVASRTEGQIQRIPIPEQDDQ